MAERREILILFDIDGTLVRMRSDLIRPIFEGLFRDECARSIDLHGFDYSGKTDSQIVREMSERLGFNNEEHEALHPRAMTYIEESLARLMSEESLRLLPGVIELLDALSARPNCTLAILTGNTPGGAKAKLDVFGLMKYFAYGTQSHDRNLLGPIAITKAQNLLGKHFIGEEVVVIGDSHRDARCANAIDARAIITLTGKELREEFANEKVFRFFNDLTDTEQVVAAILTGI
jgi:phosphoglycolate phosphatase